MTSSSKRQGPPDTGDIDSLLRLRVKRRHLASKLSGNSTKTRPPKCSTAITARAIPDYESVREKERESGFAV